jgi:LmbE family N-acetylglucosaminyl deacetylase
VSEDFDIALLSVLGQLVEAREDQGDAERRLQEYRAAETPPEIPNEFEDVDAFLDYHHRRQSYENHLRQHENALKTAKREYTEAAEQLLVFLPDSVPLRYTYEGERSELFGAGYVIVRKQGEIVIENPSRAAS